MGFPIWSINPRNSSIFDDVLYDARHTARMYVCMCRADGHNIDLVCAQKYWIMKLHARYPYKTFLFNSTINEIISRRTTIARVRLKQNCFRKYENTMWTISAWPNLKTVNYTTTQEGMFYKPRPSETQFPSYDLLKMKSDAQCVYDELQRRTLHVWSAIVWHAGEFRVSNEWSHIHSVFTVANPGRHWLLQHKQ